MSVCKERGVGWGGVWYMANTASPKVVSVCKERGVGWGGVWDMANTASPKGSVCV